MSVRDARAHVQYTISYVYTFTNYTIVASLMTVTVSVHEIPTLSRWNVVAAVAATAAAAAVLGSVAC